MTLDSWRCAVPRYLTSVKSVAAYLGGISRSTVRRWYLNANLPLTRIPGGGIITTSDEIDAWYAEKTKEWHGKRTGRAK